jgi:hypothetical protein
MPLVFTAVNALIQDEIKDKARLVNLVCFLLFRWCRRLDPCYSCPSHFGFSNLGFLDQMLFFALSFYTKLMITIHSSNSILTVLSFILADLCY